MRYVTRRPWRHDLCGHSRPDRPLHPSKLSDNPHVNPEYSQDLQALPDKLRQAFLNRDWDVFAGQMFSEWSHEQHTIAPFMLPTEWRRYNGVGWATPPSGWC